MRHVEAVSTPLETDVEGIPLYETRKLSKGTQKVTFPPDSSPKSPFLLSAKNFNKSPCQ
jgi:hypothetical protein